MELLPYFNYEHLPDHLQSTSKLFCDLAQEICKIPCNTERDMCLRKLIEAKDCAVRAVITAKELERLQDPSRPSTIIYSSTS